MSKKVTIAVKEGKICGFKTKTAYSGVEYYTFFGVPYGQSTSGTARFKDPVKVKPWTNVLDATIEKGGCKQFSLRKKELDGSEDCLYNNIYTPQLPSKGSALKAVMVNIHPGGFFHGSPDRSYFGAPDFFMHRDIVYVCIGLRLHLLGSLNLYLKDCSGKQGLKDIILSLQWIKENISVFGGDPDNVTLIGSSSGAYLVHHVLLQPVANGLYHKAIIMGCTEFMPVVVMSTENVSTAYEIAKMLDYEGKKEDHKKLLNFYKKLDFVKLFTTRPEQFNNRTNLQVYPLSPFCIAPGPLENSTEPISREKITASTNRVPVLIGFCQREACMALAVLRVQKKSIADCFHKILRQNAFGWGATLSDDDLMQIQKKVENYYLDGRPIETASQSVLCDILTDAALSDVYDSLINVISADLPSSVYVYNFHYDGKLCTMKSKIAPLIQDELKGAFHSADYSYWCYIEETAGKTMAKIQPKDRQIIDLMTNLFTTFAKTSNPNYEGLEVDWEPTTPDHPSHLIINETLQVKNELLNGERMQFWHDLKNEFKIKG